MSRSRLLAVVLGVVAVLALAVALFVMSGPVDAVLGVGVLVALVGLYGLRHRARASALYDPPTST